LPQVLDYDANRTKPEDVRYIGEHEEEKKSKEKRKKKEKKLMFKDSA